jgi:hypothetical protein
MSTESLNCNSCGAPLAVPASANFVTCTHCGTHLAVRRSQNVAYTEALERIEQKTDRIADQVEQLSQENELDRLDREWELRRADLLVTDKHGRTSVPSAAGAVVGGGIAAAFGLFWTITAASMGAPGFFPLFGVLFIVMAIFVGVSGCAKALQYNDAFAAYQRRRRELEREIAERHRG